MHYFIAKQTFQENEIRHPFLTKLPSDLLKLKQRFKEDGRKELPRKYFEMVLDQCLELMNLREVIKIIGQYKQAIKQGIDEQEHQGWHNKIQEAKKKLVDTNQQLFDKLQIGTQHLAHVVEEQPLSQQKSEELEHQFAKLDQARKEKNQLSELIAKALNKELLHKQLSQKQNLIPKEMQNIVALLRNHLSLQQSHCNQISHLQERISALTLSQKKSEDLDHELIQLNKTRTAINLLSGLIGKALDKKQVQEQLPKIENIIPKEMQNMLTLLKSHLSLQQSLESDFLKKLKMIDQALLREDEDLAPFQDNHDGNQINHLYERISTFIHKNKPSLNNLHFFKQDIVDSLRSFIRQIIQPLQQRKPEELDVLHILTNTGDVKQELQRVLASYKEYIYENDQNSQEMEIRIRNYSNQDEENKKKLQSLEEQNKEKEARIQRLTTEAQKRKDELADVKEKLAQNTKANKQLKEQNKAFQSRLSSIRSKLAKLYQQKIQSGQAHSFQNVDDILDKLKKDMDEMINSLKKAAAMIQSLTNQLRDSKESQIKLQKANKQSMEAVQTKSQQLSKSAAQIQSLASQLADSKESQNKLQKANTQSMEKVQTTSGQLSKAFASIKSLTSQLADSEESKNKLHMANTQSMEIVKKISQQLTEARETIQHNELLIKDAQETREREKTEYDGKLKQLTREIEALNKTKQSLQLDINELSKRQASAQRENEELLKKINNQRDYQRYFAHEVLYDFNYYKKTIIETIQARNYLEVKATKLLFRFDPLNKVNFHRYIDEKPNILVLIKLENGRMLACYTNHPFKPQCTGEDAFIMALNTGNIYELKKGARAISYDEYYLLFGNSEIRLRSGESLIFSNFGIANSNFDNKNQSVDALFGQGKDKRELPIAGYEIYQIIFEEER